MALPTWFAEVCPEPKNWNRWRQPAELRTRDRRYAVRTCGDTLFALRIGPEDRGQELPPKWMQRASGWLRSSAPLRVSSATLMDFLMAAVAAAPEDGCAPVAIGEDLYNARLALRDLSQVEDMPPVLRIGWTAKRREMTPLGTRDFYGALITAPQWRYIVMPLRPFRAECWRLEDACEVRP